MKIKKIIKTIVAVPLIWITLIVLLLIEEVNLGIISLASCDSKIDHEQFRVCASNGVDNDEVEPASRGWHATITLGERILPGIYRKIGGGGEDKFTLRSREKAQIQVRMSAPSTVEILIDSNEVGKFKVPEDFASQ